jgi:hypothetical protein
MPLYDYGCGTCGPFREWRSVSEWEARVPVSELFSPRIAAHCGADAGRAFVEPPDRS